MGLRDQLARLAPGADPRRGGRRGEPDALLVELDLDHEGAPDALCLAACLAAHRAYVAARGRPEGVSAGALALARLLVWAQRAAMLGPAPRIAGSARPRGARAGGRPADPLGALRPGGRGATPPRRGGRALIAPPEADLAATAA